MAKRINNIYQSFEDYANNDKDYLVTVLRDELHKKRNKIQFLDGSTYHVTKAGSRYWEYYFDGRILGFKGQHNDGHTYYYCSLSRTHHSDEAEFWQDLHFHFE
jgi:hypothetical protein